MLDNLPLFITAFAGGFLAALWLSLVLWTGRDIRARSSDRLTQILAIVVVSVANLPGLALYLLLRPSQTLEDSYQAGLEEEVLLAALSGRNTCPGCGRQVDAEWLICPSCSTRLRKLCAECHKPIELSWSVCPFCGATEKTTDPV